MTGSGTVSDPYLIYDATDLQDMNSDLSAYYELANDIDASATSTWNAGAGFVAIGRTSPYFTGQLDGKGYTIDSLFIDRATTDYLGLFSVIDGATITGIHLTNVDITGDDIIGGLIGYSDGGSISACSSAGDITGDNDIGGLIGYSDTGSIISDCSSTGDVTGDDDVGGLIGLCYQSTISECHSAVIVSGYLNTGGLIGWSSGNSISECYTTGAVTGYSYTGGLVGYMSAGSISECYATGNVAGSSGAVGVGGFVGHTAVGGTIDQCYATGSVICDDDENGGFVGQLNDTVISDCYARGAVTSSYGGGFAGTNDGSIDKCYATGAITDLGNCGGLIALGTWTAATASFWDTETTGLATSDSGTGKTTAQMKDKSTFRIAGWDFTTIWNICSGINANYPCLVGITPSCSLVGARHHPTIPTEPNRGKVLSKMGSL